MKCTYENLKFFSRIFIIYNSSVSSIMQPAHKESVNGPEDLRSIPGRVTLKTLKIVLYNSLLKTQQYKVRIKGKVEQSRERSCALLFTMVL